LPGKHFMPRKTVDGIVTQMDKWGFHDPVAQVKFGRSVNAPMKILGQGSDEKKQQGVLVTSYKSWRKSGKWKQSEYGQTHPKEGGPPPIESLYAWAGATVGERGRSPLPESVFDPAPVFGEKKLEEKLILLQQLFNEVDGLGALTGVGHDPRRGNTSTPKLRQFLVELDGRDPDDVKGMGRKAVLYAITGPGGLQEKWQTLFQGQAAYRIGHMLHQRLSTQTVPDDDVVEVIRNLARLPAPPPLVQGTPEPSPGPQHDHTSEDGVQHHRVGGDKKGGPAPQMWMGSFPKSGKGWGWAKDKTDRWTKAGGHTRTADRITKRMTGLAKDFGTDDPADERKVMKAIFKTGQANPLLGERIAEYLGWWQYRQMLRQSKDLDPREFVKPLERFAEGGAEEKAAEPEPPTATWPKEDEPEEGVPPWYIRKKDLIKKLYQGPKQGGLDASANEGAWLDEMFKLVGAMVNDGKAPDEYREFLSSASRGALEQMHDQETAKRAPEVLAFLKKATAPHRPAGVKAGPQRKLKVVPATPALRRTSSEIKREGARPSPAPLRRSRRDRLLRAQQMGNFPAVSRQRDLRAEHVPAGAAPTAYTHLLTGDRAPIGRVHEVGFGVLVGDESNNHFLTQMDADSSMGAKRMLESGRRGPFRSSSGPSRVMDKSAHVSYRRRGHTMEITVRRGVSSYELDTLIGKLAAHRMSTSNSHVFFISRRRKKIG